MTNPRRLRLTEAARAAQPELARVATIGLEQLEPVTTPGVVCVEWDGPGLSGGVPLTSWMRETDLEELT